MPWNASFRTISIAWSIDSPPTTRAGMLAECAERRPDVAARLEEAEARLSGARQELLRGLRRVARGAGGVRDLWALAELGADQAPEPGLRAA